MCHISFPMFRFPLTSPSPSSHAPAHIAALRICIPSIRMSSHRSPHPLSCAALANIDPDALLVSIYVARAISGSCCSVVDKIASVTRTVPFQCVLVAMTRIAPYGGAAFVCHLSLISLWKNIEANFDFISLGGNNRRAAINPTNT